MFEYSRAEQSQSQQIDPVQLQDVQLQLQDTQLQLQDIETFLRKESQNRVVDKSQGFPLYECLARTITFSLERLPGRNEGSDTIQRFRSSDNIMSSAVDLLSQHSKQFQCVINLLVDNFPQPQSTNDQPGNQLQEFYEKVISDCRGGRNLKQYTKLCLYAAASCLNTPIYIVCMNEFGRSGWSYFQPLFTYEGQPRCVISHVTMAMTSEKNFYKVEQRDISAPKPNATGLVGMYLEVLEDISPLNIVVPDELLGLSGELKFQICYNISRDIVVRSCILFLQRRIVQMDVYNSLTQHRAPREEFCHVVTTSSDAFKIVCQVLIARREKIVLTKYVSNWNLFVQSCDHLRQFDSLAALDSAIYGRNVSVSEFVNYCQAGEQELDERRKAVTTTVIASSSVGIVSGGMVIAGIILAPFSFGASLGLSIAGGVIGVGSGVTAGAARTIEAVKQNTKMNDVKAEQAKIEEKEKNVAKALEKAEMLFRRNFAEIREAENEELGISRRGFFAVGSAVRATNSIAHIALAAARLGTTAATVSAAVLGPLSLVFDIAFLAEAAHNKAKGDKTNAGEILQSIAETIETKSKIFNSMLRGNLQENERMNMLFYQ